MELLPYRIPTLRNTQAYMWHKGQQYLKKWEVCNIDCFRYNLGFGYFPRHVNFCRLCSKIQAVEDQDEIEEHEKKY